MIYRIEFGDDSGITKIEFKDEIRARQIAVLLRCAMSINMIHLWRMDPTHELDAELLIDWRL